MATNEQLRFKQLKYEVFIEAIQGALGTAETGNALVDVARNAHKAEQELAALKRKLEDEFDGEVDINNNGGPNSAMRVMNIVRGEKWLTSKVAAPTNLK